MLLPLAIVVACQADRCLAEGPLLPLNSTPHSARAASSDRAIQRATHIEPLREVDPRLRQPLSTTKLSPPSDENKSRRSGPLGAIFSVLGSLAIVLGIFFGVAWLVRRGLPRSGGRVPSGVIEVLGSASLAARSQMYVLRFGRKLLLVCISQGGVETLSEIEDAAEVERLIKLCQPQRSPADGAFDQVFGKLMRSTPAEQTAAGGGLAALAVRKKSVSDGEAKP
ncbi:MAG: flagellar biosynthetic protein FliO [Pirellulales bacterium]|nr:flagellar biosynthetic protein FliO [Pirellulales bacterium]